MKRRKYEIAVRILDKKYVDSLVVALARQGYAPYYNSDCIDGTKAVCFTATDEEVAELTGSAVNE
jgi:hypothetical protein